MQKQYDLLKLHMDANPNYIFGHATIAGMLATGDSRISTYEGYVEQCKRQGISKYRQELYDQFKKDCNR